MAVSPSMLSSADPVIASLQGITMRSGRSDSACRFQGNGVSFLGAIDDGLDAWVLEGLVGYVPRPSGAVQNSARFLL